MRHSASRASAPDDPTASLPATATDLVAQLWRTAPPMVWTPGRSAATERTDLSATLAYVARGADALATRAEQPEERRTASLLAETARAISAALGTQGSVAPLSSTDDASAEGQALPSQLRLRLARMECWLAARAQADRSADASATLCLWALEHLEIEIP